MAGFLLLVAAWLMPLHFLPWPSWHSEAVAFIAALAFLFALWRRGRGSEPVQVPRIVFAFFAFAAVVPAQLATGRIGFAGDGLVISLYVALCIGALVCGYSYSPAHRSERYQLQGGPDLLRALAWTLLVGALASTAVSLAQVLDIWAHAGWISRAERLRRPGGNLSQPNHLGTLVLMGVASLIYLRQCRGLGNVTAVFCFFFLSIGLAATESRTALLGLTLLCVWAFVGVQRAGLSTSRKAFAISAAGAVALFFFWPPLMSSIGLFEDGAAIDGRAGLRLVVWPQLIQASVMKPWFGWGIRQVSEAHNAVASGYATAEPYTYAHNLVLELALGVGWPLTLVFLLATSVWLYRRVRDARSPAPWFCLAATLPFAIHSSLEFPYAYAYFLLPTMLLLGTLERLVGGQPLKRVSAATLAVPVLIATAFGAWSITEYLAIEEDFRVARFEALRIGSRPADYQMPRVRLLTQLDVLLKGARIVPREGMPPAEIELARQAALRYPWPALQNRYALSLALNGNIGEARRQLRVMEALHGTKTFEEIRTNWKALATNYPTLADLTGTP